MLEEMLAGVGVFGFLEQPLVPCLLQFMLDHRCLHGGAMEAGGLDHTVTLEHLDDDVLHHSRDMLESSTCLSA